MPERVIDFHLLGQLPLGTCCALQERIVGQLRGTDQVRAAVLLCEHPPVITVGRSGSRRHIRISGEELRRQQLEVCWVERSGGCILHAPGQLVVYLLVPQSASGWRPAELRRDLDAAVASALTRCGVTAALRSEETGLWGRSGLLVAVGAVTRAGVSRFAAAINVAPAMAPFGFVDTAAADGTVAAGAPAARRTMSCLLAERRLPVRMASVRSAVTESLAERFQADRYNIHSGHPWLPQLAGSVRDDSARAS